jgi:hypothetical protein
MAGSAQHSFSSTNVYNEDDKTPGLTAAWTPFCNDKRPVTFKPLTDDKLTAQVLPLSMKCPICDHIFEDYAEYKDHENDCWICVYFWCLKNKWPRKSLVNLFHKGGESTKQIKQNAI